MNTHKNHNLILSALAGFWALSGSALAATDGSLGATSTGTADITLAIAEQFQISNMNDFAFGTYGGTGNLTADDDICVYHNGDGSYKVTITDDSALSVGFAVEDGAASEIPLTVSWNDQTGTTGSILATYNVSTAAQNGANTTTADCSSGGLSANMEVSLLQADLQAASAGSYSTTITVLVEPD